MTDELTTDELVKLAEACGYERIRLYCQQSHADVVLVAYDEKTVFVGWHPDTDANQMCEVIEAFIDGETRGLDIWWQRVSGFVVRVKEYVGVWCDWKTICTVRADTLSLAVCRAALTALEGETPPNAP